MPRITRYLALAAVLLLIAAACGDDDASPTTTAAPATTSAAPSATTAAPATTTAAPAALPGEGLKMAWIYDGGIVGGWGQGHDRARQFVEQQLPGIETINVEQILPGQPAQAAMAELAEDGYDVVILTSFFQPDILEVAPLYPDTVFLHWGGFQDVDNSASYDIGAEEGRYIDGMIAGSMTESNIIGYVLGFPLDGVVKELNGFALGVQEVNPDAKILAVFTNSWFDPPKEQQAAEAFVTAGADVLVSGLNSPATSQVAVAEDKWYLGYGEDESQLAPDHWLTTFVYEWGAYYVSVAESVRDGNFKSHHYYGVMGDGVMGLSTLHNVPQNIIDIALERRQQMIDGTFDVFAPPLVDNTGVTQLAAGSSIAINERVFCCNWLNQNIEGEIAGS